MKHILFILSGCFFTLAVTAQSTEALALKWRIMAPDSLVYAITVSPVNNRDELPYSQHLAAPIALLLDSIQAKLRVAAPEPMDPDPGDYTQSLLAGFLGVGSEPLVFAKLKERKPDAIEVQMYLKKSAEEKAEYLRSVNSLLDLAGQGEPGVDSAKEFIDKMLADTAVDTPLFQGRVGAGGGMQSFYLPVNQKNSLALFFELPKNSVRLHDSWPLDVHFIVQDALEADSSFWRGQVTLREIRQRGQDRIAVLDYDFTEFVAGAFRHSPATVAFSYRAVGEFSVRQGRWIKYDGIASMHLTGEEAAPFAPLDAQLLIRFPQE